MHLTKLAIIPAILSLLALPACGAKKSKKRDVSGPATKVEYFVHGNPLILIQGSVQNKQSFLKVADVESYANFTLSGYTGFVEKSLKDPPKNWDDVEDANSTESEEDQIREAFKLSDYKFVKRTETSWSYESSDPEGEKLGFVDKDGVLELKTFNDYPVQVQHYSLKKDGSAFSVLFTLPTSNQGNALLTLSFASNAKEEPLVFAPEGYSFLHGSAKVAWKEPMKLQACGTFNANEKASIEQSVQSWFKDQTPINSLVPAPLAFSFATSYAPFSDLNQQCIHLVRNFKAESSDDFFVAGLAASSVNTASKALIDSDIFLFVDHAPVRQQLIFGESETLVHEIGHFLGLGHEFRKDENDKALHPSIMGYSQGTTSISAWDFEAIRSLYGAPLRAADPI
ncbi:MAG TPA: matrixin family metalloprotease [Oligoflexus sp.]|uniref:matrixin family metalloprotease n=1 Tax=Oligoflexus sp. TaxID=1971216 RepID=UPI002D80C56F|nr:matrixin family metalloprotease [Oligoflexus sp.]HET9237683.1 matrixin family metalloprotease [Oligoflexus sp.]